MKQKVWLSFDLGVEGDYEGLYEWLGEWGAEECGDSVAVFSYPYKSELVGELLKDLSDDVKLSKRARLYLIYRDPATRKLTGKFIAGGRRRAPWAEYMQASVDDVEDVLFSPPKTTKPRRRSKQS